MENKKLSDYEKIFLEKIENKTIKELLHDHRSSGYAKRYHQYHADSIILELKKLPDGLEKEFFRFALKEKGFLDIPIIVAVPTSYYDCDCYYHGCSLLIEKTPIGYYKSIDFNLDNGDCWFSLKRFPGSDAILYEGSNTIGDFINRNFKTYRRNNL